jgi:hypothetical protein
MSPSKRYAKKQAKARQRRRLQAHARLERDRRQAQRAAAALHQALEALGLPANLVVEIEGRLHSQHQRLGKLVGVLFPALFGCRPPRSCVACGAGTSLGPPGCSGLCPNAPGSSGGGAWGWRWWSRSGTLWRPRARPPRGAGSGPGSGMTRCFTRMVSYWGGGRGWSGQPKRVLSGIDGLLLLVVIGAGRWVVPGDFAMRRPDPVGPGAPVCRTLKHLWGTEAGQVPREDAYDGHLGLRLMGSWILVYTSRVICKGCLTMEEILFSLKHYWRLVDLEALG